MKTALLLGLFLLGSFQIDAKHGKKKSTAPAVSETSEAKKPVEETAPEPATGGFAFPSFAIRIPMLNFGVLGRMKEQIDNIMKAKKENRVIEEKSYKGKVKTRTKTSNSTDGPFKTYTITTETVTEGNKTVPPKVIAKLVKTITTLDKSKLPKGKKGEKPADMALNMNPFAMTGEDLDIHGEKCSSSSDCKKNLYCDAFFNVCKKQLAAGTSCTQKDQCDSKGGRYRCTWGRCVLNSYEGSTGTFCDADSECHSTSEEELGCARQPDLSRFARVCTPKLGEGSTCGRAGIFDLFKHDDELSSRCKTGLECKTVGFFGRKACIRPLSDGLSDQNDEKDEKKHSKKDKEEDSTEKESKSKKLRF